MSLEIFGNGIAEVPEALTLRPETYTMALIAVLSACFLLIAFSTSNNNRSIQTVATVFFRNSQSMEVYLKENMRMNSVSSIVLIFNYFIGFSLCNFIFFYRIIGIEREASIWLCIVIPLFWFFLETIGVFIAGFITGEQKKLTVTMLNTINGVQFTGLLFSGMLLFWIINPEINKLFMTLFLAVICLKTVTRMLKSSENVLSLGISWYYIIIYFCTLEILPLFVAYHYFLKNFLY